MMRTICGMTLRGVAYFGASVHICIGVLFFGLLLDRLVDHVYYRSLNVESLHFDKESVIYFGLFLPLGILIFKAIDKENKTLLKWATAVFLALQLFGIIIRIKYGYISSSSLIIKSRNLLSVSPNKMDTAITIETFKVLAMELISTISYIVSLYFYERQLESFPGRIYAHGGNTMIPLYSTNSSTYFLPSDHAGHHGNRLMSSGSPYFEPPPPYSSVNNLNGITIATDGQTGQFHQYHHPSGQVPSALPLPPLQQPCSSRSVFANIGRIRAFGSKKSSSSSSGLGNNHLHHQQNNNNQHHHHHHQQNNLGSAGGVGTPASMMITASTTSNNLIGPNNTIITTTALIAATAHNNNHNSPAIDNQVAVESDSPSAALLENHRRTSQDSSQSRIGGSGVGGCGAGFLLSSSRVIKDLD